MKHLKIKEKEKRQKLKEASKTGENKKLSRAEAAQKLKKLSKGGQATILKVSFFTPFSTKADAFQNILFLVQTKFHRSGSYRQVVVICHVATGCRQIANTDALR